MGNTTISASQLIDLDGTPLEGLAWFGSSGDITLAISAGVCNGSVPSGSYDALIINSYSSQVASIPNITLPDGGTFALDAEVNGTWAIRVGDTWLCLTGQHDLIQAGLQTYLPREPAPDQVVTVLNTSDAALVVWSPVGLGNASTPGATQISLPSLGAIVLRFDGSFWRILSLDTLTQ